MPEKLFGVASLRELVASVAGPRTWSDNRDSWLSRAARRAGISYRQARALFYGEITDVNHRSARLMRDAAEGLSGRHEAKIDAAHACAKALASRFEKIARAMESADPDFYSTDIAALVHAARKIRDLDLPGDAEAK